MQSRNIVRDWSNTNCTCAPVLWLVEVQESDACFVGLKFKPVVLVAIFCVHEQTRGSRLDHGLFHHRIFWRWFVFGVWNLLLFGFTQIILMPADGFSNLSLRFFLLLPKQQHLDCLFVSVCRSICYLFNWTVPIRWILHGLEFLNKMIITNLPWIMALVDLVNLWTIYLARHTKPISTKFLFL